ncbi:MAG: hypothetical protein CFE34_06325 [Rhodobacteraceae bacterium PARR1]|nr:MAG: hypothetical protein CFE34_06325 [Rhodobacteraceae bacterium PARR1]
MLWAVVVLGLLILGAGAYVRLAPSDPTIWHIAPGTEAAADCAVLRASDSARLACVVAETPAAVLARLDAVAMATPRTLRLAGSAEEGRITWITRTRLWGFPDYTTAEARAEGTGTRLDFYARQRIGSKDWGVNAARLTDWKAALGL